MSAATPRSSSTGQLWHPSTANLCKLYQKTNVTGTHRGRKSPQAWRSWSVLCSWALARWWHCERTSTGSTLPSQSWRCSWRSSSSWCTGWRQLWSASAWRWTGSSPCSRRSTSRTCSYCCSRAVVTPQLSKWAAGLLLLSSTGLPGWNSLVFSCRAHGRGAGQQQAAVWGEDSSAGKGAEPLHVGKPGAEPETE